jgi:hypothetical protein
MAKKAAKKTTVSTTLTPKKAAGSFMYDHAPKAIRQELPEKGDFDDFLTAVLKLRMDQTVFFGAGSTPGNLLPGKRKAAVNGFMETLEIKKKVARKEGATGKQIQAKLIAVISTPENTGSTLATALSEIYDF